MCGKFTPMASLAPPHAFPQPLGTVVPADGGGGDTNDYELTFRPYSMLNVIVWDAQEQKRKIVQMRWGLPDLKTTKS